MKYLKVKNWERFQHYTKRNPPWIKLHKEILDDQKFISLSPTSKCLLILTWLLASENEGKIEIDLENIQFRLRNPKIKGNDFKILINKGFLIDDSNVLADDSKVIDREEKRREETEKKVQHQDSVFLYKKEYEKLVVEHGAKITNEAIKILDLYKMSSGKKYKSDYHALLKWGIDRAKQDTPQPEEQKPSVAFVGDLKDLVDIKIKGMD